MQYNKLRTPNVSPAVPELQLVEKKIMCSVAKVGNINVFQVGFPVYTMGKNPLQWNIIPLFHTC